jgi:hypothetical protein
MAAIKKAYPGALIAAAVLAGLLILGIIVLLALKVEVPGQLWTLATLAFSAFAGGALGFYPGQATNK